MSTRDQPSQPLTRRRLRELKLTGQTPVIAPEEADAAKAASEAEAGAPEPAEPEAAEVSAEYGEAPAFAAQDDADAEYPVRAAAEEVAAFEQAAAESSAPDLDFGGRPMTRREIREFERLRTAQVQVVLPPVEGIPAIPIQGPERQPDDTADQEGETQLAAIETVVVSENETSVVYEVVEVPFADAAGSEDAESTQTTDETEVHELVYEDADGRAEKAEQPHRADEEFADHAVQTVFVVEDAPTGEVRAAEEQDAPRFEQQLFAPTAPEPESFEQILTHAADSSGSSSAGSTLILASDPSTIPLSAPITATGELLITSSHTLPDGFGSRGHAQGTTDGKEVDVVLLDGELPFASSPTPLSASDAVSTSKSPSEVIRPPAPEKTHRLTLILGIAAGVLGIALIGVVVAAFTTGIL